MLLILRRHAYQNIFLTIKRIISKILDIGSYLKKCINIKGIIKVYKFSWPCICRIIYTIFISQYDPYLVFIAFKIDKLNRYTILFLSSSRFELKANESFLAIVYLLVNISWMHQISDFFHRIISFIAEIWLLPQIFDFFLRILTFWSFYAIVVQCTWLE